MTESIVQQADNEDPKPKAKTSTLGESFSLESVSAIPKEFLRPREQPPKDDDTLKEQSE